MLKIQNESIVSKEKMNTLASFYTQRLLTTATRLAGAGSQGEMLQ